MQNLEPAVHPGTMIGHVHLKVANLDRAITFYCDAMGFELQQRMGRHAAFLSAGGYHHHIGLNTWESQGARHRLREPPVYITSQFSILNGASWPGR